ncbi:MAG TPA: phospho-N-acetylmuramoyl-pentapeptide-transferase [Verrucomicrobiae bacterium]|nr:phospho-N-acetylmuramoyl-pentapeptide-transferase [Verrucomicrobiae bacterium]
MDQTLHIALSSHALLKILLLAVGGFVVSTILTPLYTTVAFKLQLWKRPRETTVTGQQATIVAQLHAEKRKTKRPTMAGVLFIITVGLLTMWFNLSRSQTWLPLAAFFGAGLVGFIDDIINLRSNGKGTAGLRPKLKLLLMIVVALIGGWFFYRRLGVDTIHWPGVHAAVHIGWWIVPLFVLVVVATANAVNISDGVDGLAGGLVAIAFAFYAVIALLERRYGIAGFCLTLVGTLLSYTWFNLFPARFLMGDVGSFALGTALGVVAMQTDTVLLLPVIGLVFVAEAGSVLLQITSKKLRNGKKIFKVSPVHYLFQLNGWPETKVTERFWIIGLVAGFVGLVLYVLGWYA